VRISRLLNYISEIRLTRDRSQLIKKSKKYIKYYSNITCAIKIYKRNLQSLYAQHNYAIETFLSTHNSCIEISRIVRFCYTNYYNVNE